MYGEETIRTYRPTEEKNEKEFDFGNNVSIDLLSDWVLKDTMDSSTFIFAEECKDSLNLCSNLIVRFVENENGLHLDEVVELFLSSLPERFEAMQVISINDHKTQGLDMKIVDYKMREEGVDLGSTCAFFLMGDKVASLYFTGKNVPVKSYLDERKKGMQMINTLKLNVSI
jgi:hypothetical protein